MTALLLAAKDLRLLLRDRTALFWAVAFPCLFAALFGAVLRRTVDGIAGPITVAYVDDAHGALRDALAARTEIRLVAASEEEARARVLAGEAIAALHVRVDGSTPTLVVERDPSHTIEAAAVERVVREAIDARRGDGCASARIESRVVESDVPFDGAAIALPAAILWGLIGCAGSFAGAIVAERRSGTLLRLLAAPISPATILAGKVLACFFACLIDALLLALVARFVLGLRVERPLRLAASIASCATCFAGLTCLLGSIGSSEQAVSGASWAFLLLLAMLGGAMVPTSMLPPFVRVVGAWSPVRWGIAALEASTFRAARASCVGPCLRLGATGVLAVIAAARLGRRR